MDRRGIFRVMAAALLAVPFVNRKAVAAEGGKKAHKIVVHVDQNDAHLGFDRRCLASRVRLPDLLALTAQARSYEQEQKAS